MIIESTKSPIMSCMGIPTTKIFICGIVRERIPSPTFVSRIANVIGIAIFMPVRKIVPVKFAMMSAREIFASRPASGTARKLSTSAAMSMWCPFVTSRMITARL